MNETLEAALTEEEQLARMRHSCAHLMAAAIQDLWPEAKSAVVLGMNYGLIG